MRLVGLSAMVRVTREFAALDRNSSILPATVLLNGTPAKEVATPLPMSADRQTVEKSIKPPGVKSAPPMWKASGEKGRPLLSTSTDGVAGSAGGATADCAGAAAGALCAVTRWSSNFCCESIAFCAD